MLKINISIDGQKALDEHILYIKKLLSMRTDKKFQKFIQEKCLETVKKVTNQRLTFSGPTVEEYKNNHKIKEYDNGFLLYNDTVVSTETDGYDGSFSIALAFEYGTGIIGAGSPVEGSWEYNVNHHERGWIYFKNNAFHFTAGYAGFEIYRYACEEIKNNLEPWVNEYFNKKGV